MIEKGITRISIDTDSNIMIIILVREEIVVILHKWSGQTERYTIAQFITVVQEVKAKRGLV